MRFCTDMEMMRARMGTLDMAEAFDDLLELMFGRYPWSLLFLYMDEMYLIVSPQLPNARPFLSGPLDLMEVILFLLDDPWILINCTQYCCFVISTLLLVQLAHAFQGLACLATQRGHGINHVSIRILIHFPIAAVLIASSIPRHVLSLNHLNASQVAQPRPISKM